MGEAAGWQDLPADILAVRCDAQTRGTCSTQPGRLTERAHRAPEGPPGTGPARSSFARSEDLGCIRLGLRTIIICVHWLVSSCAAADTAVLSFACEALMRAILGFTTWPLPR